MAKCSICSTSYYHQTWTDPSEPCDCGECASGPLWQWDKHRAYIKYFRWSLGQFFYNIATKLCSFHLI